MTYNPTIWQDKIVDAGGNIVQQGTPVSAAKLNNIENGIANHESQLADKQTQINNLSTNKADKTEINNLATAKANKTDLDATNATVANNYSTLDTKINSQTSGSPKGVYATLTALTTVFPTGNSNIYVVTADGGWYYWNGSAWTKGGVYQSTALSDGSVSNNILSESVLNSVLNNMFSFDNFINKVAVAASGGTVNVDNSYTATSGANINNSYVSFVFTKDLLLYFKTQNPIVAFDVVFNTSGDLTNVYNAFTVKIRNALNWADLGATYNIKRIGNIFRVVIYTTTLCPSYQFTIQFGSAVPSANFTVNIQNIKVGSISSDISSLWYQLAFMSVGKNLFNKLDVSSGYYVNSSNGNLVANSDFSASDYIQIAENTTFSVSNGIAQFAYYDSSKAYISGVAKANSNDPGTYTTPSNAAYVRFSVATAQLDTAQVELGSQVTSYESYTMRMSKNYLPSDIVYQQQAKTNVITVKQDGTGDYTKFSDAVKSITNSSNINQYEIDVYEGTYDIMSELFTTPPTGSSGTGLILPDYVNIKGIGKRENIILKGELPDNSNQNAVTNISTLNLRQNNNLENLTITAKNLRYAVHDESSNTYKFWTKNVKNCTIIHYGNQAGYWTTPTAWGEGCSDGSHSEFYDCEFYSYQTTPAYLVHNNTNFTKPSYHLFDNCKFSSPLALSDGSFLLQSYGSNVNDDVVCVGCKFDGLIQLSKTGVYSGKHNFKLRGHGNSIIPQKIDTSLTNPNETFIDFSDEGFMALNQTGNIILKGVACKMDGTGRVKPISNGDTATMFAGFAQHDIANNVVGTIKNRGYVALSVIGVTANVGDKIGIVNGSLAVVTSGDYLGVVNVAGYMLIK